MIEPPEQGFEAELAAWKSETQRFTTETLFLKRRFTEAFSALVSTRKHDTRIYVGDLAHRLYELTNRDWDAKLKRYLRYSSDAGARPNMESAWIIGESLRREFEIKWCSGFWMLYASGRLEDFLGVFARFIDDQLSVPSASGQYEYNHEEIQDFWIFLREIEHLTLSTVYDVDPVVASVHIGKNTCDDATLLISNESRRDVRRGIGNDGNRWEDDFNMRERAKEHWCKIERYIPRLEKAYDGWKTTRKGMRNSTLIDGAIAVARSSDFDPQGKEWAAFKIVEAAMLWWLDSADIPEIQAFEGAPPPPFWRQVELHGIW